MKLHNSLTNRIDELKPFSKGKIGLYTCGPTVYDHVHIGNLRTYIFEDTLRRVLKLNGYDVKHVMNITDVDDKTITRSQQEYPDASPESALKQLTTKYEKLFLEDAQKVGIDFSESKIVKATDHIKNMQQLIEAIPNRYTEPDGVYFDITKYKDYGVFTKLDRSHTHHRIDNDEYDKEHVADFALWKAKKGNEPAWDFELDGQNIAGRPGWHIECSAMSTKYLGQPFDIHTGGVDLKFPHHENEIAQSKAVNGKSLANIFVHGEHLLVDGKKMAKSAKNFYTLEDIEKKGFDPLAFRLLVLQAHYRSQLNFTWKSLEAAQNHLDGLRAWADLRYQGWIAAPYQGFDEQWDKSIKHLEASVTDDLNTPKALAILSELADWLTQRGVPKSDSRHSDGALKRIDAVLGLNLSARSDIPDAQKKQIQDRENARKLQDFEKADKIRQDLEKQGIGLNDNPYGATWYRLTPNA